MIEVGEWFFVSDLHLDGTARSRRIDEALPRFLRTVVLKRPGPGRHLVLLGDTFDLSGQRRVTDQIVSARLRALSSTHCEVFAALGECVRAGVTLHVVGGNHDVELVRPESMRTLAGLLGTHVDDPGLQSHPWLVHVPGVLYAEHGNQHHELHRIPAILSVPVLDDSTELPVTPLGAWAPGGPSVGERGRGRMLLRAIRETRQQERLVSSPGYLRLLEHESKRQQLPLEAVRALAEVSRFTVPASSARVAMRILARRCGRRAPGDYLLPRAVEIHKILQRHGGGAAAYVFGHSHRAGDVRLPGFLGASVLNSGTWGADVREIGPDTSEPRLFPYVLVRSEGGHVTSRQGYWRADAEMVGTTAEV